MEGETSALLSLLIATPILGSLILLVVPREQVTAHRYIGIAISGLVFVMSLPLLSNFDPTTAEFQFAEKTEWIEAIGASWSLGLDGISLWVVLLTTFLTPLMLIGSHTNITHRVREFVIAMLVLESAMIGALVATDLLLFFLFWELMLVPMYLLIGIWGSANRIYATIKFFIYTMVGSLLMLIAILYLYIKADYSFAYADILALSDQLDPTEQFWLFTAFALAFCIKVPMVPFHTWLPDAHTEAPMAGSVVLAGVLLKMGTYGLLRFALPLFPSAMGDYSVPIMLMSVVGIVYGALLAFAQKDLKKLVAYSSVSHLGFVMLGIVALNQQAVEGAILQMVNHGISTGALFFLVGFIYHRTHTRDIDDYGGYAKKVPIFSALFMVVTLSSIGLPLTNGFAGEFMILSGTFQEALPIYKSYPFWPIFTVVVAIIATTGVVLGAVYMLNVFRKVFFGPEKKDDHHEVADLNKREIGVLIPLVAFIFIIGLSPGYFVEPMHASVKNLVAQTKPQVREVRDAERLEIEVRKGVRRRASNDARVPTHEREAAPAAPKLADAKPLPPRATGAVSNE